MTYTKCLINKSEGSRTVTLTKHRKTDFICFTFCNCNGESWKQSEIGKDRDVIAALYQTLAKEIEEKLTGQKKS